MKLSTTFIIVFLITTQLFSQDGWNYQIINSSNNNQHGAICVINEDLVYVIMDNGVFLKSFDGGENWTEYDTGVSEYFYDMAFYNSEIGFAVGSNANIIKTTNGGEDWTLLSSGTFDLFSISIPSVDAIWIVGDYGTILKSTNLGNSWLFDDSLTNEGLNSISFRDTDTGFIAGNNGTLFHTLNGGITWNESNISTSDDLFSLSTTNGFSFLLAGYVDEDDNSNFGYSGFKTSNNVDWINFPIPNSSPSITKLYFKDDDLGFSGVSECLLCDCCMLDLDKTTTSGNDWEDSCYFETSSSNQLSWNYLDIDFATNDVGYVLCGSVILKTIDGGTNTEIILNINDFYFDNSLFTIYPNPSNQTNFNINFSNLNIDYLTIDIIDINGKRIFSETKLHNDMNIDISNFSKGIYFVELIKNGTIIDNQKLIVNK